MNNAAAKLDVPDFETLTDRKPPASERSSPTSQPHDSSTRHSGSREIQESPGAKTIVFPIPERLLNAREVAARLGVSERWVRDHTTRRSPKIRGVKLGPLMRYRIADVEEFTRSLLTSKVPQSHSY
jgi:predicted DNA-binding transcriptional regulator AlpA